MVAAFNCRNLIFDPDTYTYVCLDTGEVIFDVLETSAIDAHINGNIKYQYRKTRNDDLKSAQTFTITANNLCAFGRTVSRPDETRVLFELQDSGLKAKLWRTVFCKSQKRWIKVSWLSIDFTNPNELYIRRLIIDHRRSRKYTIVVHTVTHRVKFNYVNGRVPPAEVRRLAVSAAIVMAFLVYTDLNAKAKTLKRVNRQHRSIAYAASYILWQAGYIKPYTFSKGKITKNSVVTVDEKPVNSTLVMTPWQNIKSSKKDVVKLSLKYLASVAKKISQSDLSNEAEHTKKLLNTTA